MENDNNNVIYLDFFGVEHSLCIGFIDFKLKKKTLTEYTNLFSPNNLMMI